MSPEIDVAPRARITADIDTPDKIAYGLTARQLAILAVAGVLALSLYRSIGRLLPPPVLLAGLIPLVGAAVVLALGRRDGLPMDAWLFAALRHTHARKRLAPAPTGRPAAAPPGWAPRVTSPPAPVPVLRLPARSIGESGMIDTGDQAMALVACATVNIGLRSGPEQAALLDGYGRWLNSLSGPVQIVVSTQRVDLSGHAERIAQAADALPNEALAEAAYDYAEFLHELAVRRDPLWRTLTLAVTSPPGPGAETDVLRRADHTASALAALGAQTAVLDGERATAVLACATDPYSPVDTSWARARPGAPVTGRSPLP